MIESSCPCGHAVTTPVSNVGKSSRCERCGKRIRFICAEALPEDGGGGDFDAQLIVESGPENRGDVILLGGINQITIGKLPDRNIVLNGNRVSRFHCKLVRVDFGPSRWEIHDNKSTNGMFVNDERLEVHELQVGDVVRIGDYVLRYALAPEAAPEQPRQVYTGPFCPSCRNPVPANAKICVKCGVDVKTGRSLVVSKGLDEDELAIRADTWIRTLSWLIPFGFFPIASEAFGTKRPHATWAIFGLTVLTSLWFVITVHSQGEDVSTSVLNLLQWNGQAEASDDLLAELRRELEQNRAESGARASPQAPKDAELDEELQAMLMELESSGPDLTGVGFRWYQPFTGALLHDPDLIMPFIYHLGGNMLFLLVFGLRVNELIGNWRFAVVYPLLAFGSGMADHIIQASEPLYPSLGASGAIMGLAGMYFVFFPAQRVHMAIWFRGGMLTKWECIYKIFTMRGFWLLVLWTGYNDILPTALGLQDNVAHWSHLGGFAVGAALALVLLISRQTTAHGGDLLSVALGKRAWALVGRPGNQTAAST